MAVIQMGAVNATAALVPDLYVSVVAPRLLVFAGVPSNTLGIVGTASWGPVNAPAVVGSMSQYAEQFGAIANRKHDLGTALAAAVMQGAADFRAVRVTDGTDTAAAVTVQTDALTITSRYTGSLGNSIRVTLDAGGPSGTYRVSVAMPGRQPETFGPIGAGLTGAALWAEIARAINQGVAGVSSASQMVVATAGAGTAAPVVPAVFTLAGGTDGAAVTSAMLVGLDTGSRTGMYALRGSGASVAMLADCDDSTTWTTQMAFGLSEGVYMVATGPAGDTIANALATKAAAGIDSYSLKLLFGDWVYWSDPVNGVTRLVSPQAFVAGLLTNMSPERSSLNKQVYGVVATQRTRADQRYSGAELQQLTNAGIDLITNPVPGGAYFGVRLGRNSSSDPRRYGDNYTRLTNYITATLNARMGVFIGDLQSDDVRRRARGAIEQLLAAMEGQGMIGGTNGAPAFRVKLDATNNPPERVAAGFMQADVAITYLSIIERFFINVEGGQSVRIERAPAV